MTGRGGRGTVPVRGYGLTQWSRAVVDIAEGRTGDAGPAADGRRIVKARSYFRDRNTRRLTVGPGTVTASVWGSQLEPFTVRVSVDVIDTSAVAAALRDRGAAGEMLSLNRGEQPPALGGLLIPDAAAVTAECDCPDSADRCIHILAVAYEVAAEIDRTSTTLLTLRGTAVPDLLAALGDTPAATADGVDRHGNDTEHGSDDRQPVPAVDFYGTGATAPPLPRPPSMNPLTDLDAGALRAALRASGVPAADLAEAVDELGDLYDRLAP